MNERDDQFIPERVDEQIEAFSRPSAGENAPSASAHLVFNLRGMYQEDRAIAEQVWTRLAEQVAMSHGTSAGQEQAQSRSPRLLQEERQKGSQTMSGFIPEEKQKKEQKKRRWRSLEMLAAVLIIAVLVASMAFLFRARQPSLAGKGTPTGASKTPTASPPSAVTSQNGLYITTKDGVERVSLTTTGKLTTGKLIWHSGSGTTDSLLVDQGIVVFAGGDTFGPPDYSNYYLEAVSAANGKQIWRKPYGGIIYPLQGANGIVYVSWCGAADTSTCSIDAVQISNGSKLWSSTSNLGTIWELYQDGVVYGVNYSHFFALNATSGARLWQKTLQHYPDQEAAMTPVVSSKELYFATCNETKQTPTYLSCYFFAFNATSGEEVWHVPLGSDINKQILALPTAMDGVVYAATLDGVIHAFDAKTGAPLWNYATGGQIDQPLLSSQGLLSAEVQSNSANRLLALKVSASSHSVVWSQNIFMQENSPNDNPPVLENGLIHVLASPNSIMTSILTLQAATGGLVQSYQPQPGTVITSFSFVQASAG